MLTTLDFQPLASLLSSRVCARNYPLLDKVSISLWSDVLLVKHLDELIEQVVIELDLCPGMAFLLHSLLSFVPTTLA